MNDSDTHVCDGLGDKSALFNVYIGNRPAIDMIQNASGVLSMRTGDIDTISKQCGNGWRKVFNVYAKLLFAANVDPVINSANWSTWQQYRDAKLLQSNSNTALFFTPPIFTKGQQIHIIMGKTYATSLPLPRTLRWLTPEFAIDEAHNLIICPYFDYRQLSNQKILFLIELLSQLSFFTDSLLAKTNRQQ